MSDAPLSLWVGYGDNDPNGVELNDCQHLLVVSLDQGQPDEAADRREIVVTVEARGESVAEVRRWVGRLSQLAMRAAQHRSGTLPGMTVRMSHPSIQTTWWDVLAIEVTEGEDGINTALAFHWSELTVTFTTRAYGRGWSRTVVSEEVIDASNPVVIVPAIDTDAPAQLEVDLDDLTRGGTGVNRYRIAAMPLANDGSLPGLAIHYTDADTQDDDAGTLDGNAPLETTVDVNWSDLASGTITWDDEFNPPPRAVALLTRLADAGAAGAPIDILQLSLDDGPLAIAQAIEDTDASLTFGAIAAGSMLVVGVRANSASAFTWPAGWTVQASANAGGYRIEVATKAIATDTAFEAVSVTTGGTENYIAGYAVPGADAVAGTVTLTSGGTVTLPGSGYHASFVFYGAVIGRSRPPGAPIGFSPQDVVSTSIAYVTGARLGTAHPITARLGGSLGVIGDGAPGSMTFRPGTSYNQTFSATSENGTVREKTVSTFVPAESAHLVAITLSTSATAPNMPAGTWRGGVTLVTADGEETPLTLTDTVGSGGLRPIRGDWALRASGLPNTAQIRFWYQREGQSWRYIEVEPEETSVTVSDETTGTVGTPPQGSQLAGVETRAMVRPAVGATPAQALPPVATQVGGGLWELVPHGVVPLPLVPGGTPALHVTIQGRSITGQRAVRLDETRLVPVHQELGALVAELRDQARPVPMRWRHWTDPHGRARMALTGQTGDVDLPDGIRVLSLGVEDDDDPDWTVRRIRVGEAVTNLDPTHSFGLDAPAWMGAVPTNGGSATDTPGLVTEDAGANAYEEGGDSHVLRAKATGSVSPAVPVTVGTQYTASGFVRIPPGGSAATIRMRIVWYGSNGVTSVGQADGATVTTTSTWQPVSVTATAPTGAVVARVHLIWASGTADVWLDAVQFEAGASRNVYQRRDRTSPNLLVNPTFTGGSYGWHLHLNAAWQSDGSVRGSSNDGLTSNPVRVRAGVSYTLSAGVKGDSTGDTAFLSIRWFNGTGAFISSTDSGFVGAGNNVFTRRSVTGTAPANAVSAQVRLQSGASGVTFDDVTFVEGGSTTFADPEHTVSRGLGGPLVLIKDAPLADVTAERGWLLVRCNSYSEVPATVLDWRADDANYLALEFTSTDVILKRVTGGVTHSVSASRVADRDVEMVVYATWTATQLGIRVHDGTAWGTTQTAASTAWPDLAAADWRLGNRLPDAGTQDQWLRGRLVWAALGTDPTTFDPTTDSALVGEEPIPDDVPDAAALAWLWTSTNPARLVVWRDAGYATVSGAVHGLDRPVALIVIGEQAGWEHRAATTRVSVRAIPRYRYLREEM